MEPRILAAWPGWPNEEKLRVEQLSAVLGSAVRQHSSFVSE